MRHLVIGALAALIACGSAWAQNSAPMHPGLSFPPVPGHDTPIAVPPANSTPTPPFRPTPVQVPVQPQIHSWPPPAGTMPATGQVDLEAHRLKLRPASRQEPIPSPPRKAGEGEERPMEPLVPGTPLLVEDYVPYIEDQAEFYRVPRGYKWYGRGEYLLWWFKDRGAPPLLTIGPPGAAGTTVIGGTGELPFDNQERHGGRFTGGRWLGPDQHLAFEASYFFFGQRVPSLDVTGPSLSRPFFNTSLNVPAQGIIAAPGVATGAAHIEALSRAWGAEGNVRAEFLRTGWGHLDWLLGFRTFALDESLKIESASTTIAVIAAPSTIIVSDRFGTHNNLWAAQLGFEGELNYGSFFIEGRQKVAFGPNRQVVRIEGNTIATGGGTAAFGLLAAPSNIGYYTRDQFTVLLESGVSAGFKLGPNIRLFADYTFLFLNNTVRPGDQMDGRLQVFPGVGAPAPLFFFRDSQFWAQGLGLGMEIRF